METAPDKILVDARESLLDAVEALERHSKAVILVGAQAVYAHTEAADAAFAVSPYTVDTDIALDPDSLGTDPAIVDAMIEAGFRLSDQPGLYTRDEGAPVDLYHSSLILA